MRNDTSDVVFVTMPFAMPEHPSLGLSLLKSALDAAGIDCRIEYLNLSFAEDIGFATYGQICRTRETDLIGEWVFSSQLFEIDRAKRGEFRRLYLDSLDADFVARLDIAQSRTRRFLDRATQHILSRRPKVVGFTSVFQQHTASLALAQRLKARDPQIQILFGGPNCEATMGATLVGCFDFVDAVVSGQADLIIVDLVKKLLARRPLGAIPGVYTAENLLLDPETGVRNAPSVQSMDGLPEPDFTDFFEQAGPLDRAGLRPRLLFETARGCWWGEKHHCTFCGLNGTDMRFRSKSPERALAELERLVQRYGITEIGAVDNILDMKYLKTVVPELASRNLGLNILYEVKSNLKKDQLRALKSAGISSLQPGIESLSTPVLKLMRKGVTAIQNVQLLKWCCELGITVSWNILWGFPGEIAADYEAMAKLSASLTHLSPPTAQGKLRLDRFSPNFDRAADSGLTEVRPLPAYGLVYDLDAAALEGLAYYFTFDYADGRDVESYTRSLSDAIAGWRAVHPKSQLLSIDYNDALLVADWRTDTRSAQILQGLQRALYLQCDEISSVRTLLALAASYGEPMSASELERQLQPLLDCGVLLREGDTFLALAVALDEYVCAGPLLDSLRAMATMLLAA